MVALFNSFVSCIRTNATQSLRRIIRRLRAITSRRTLMHHRLALLCLLSCTLGPAAYAAATAGCDDKLMYTLRHLQLVVGTLRPDKAGQMRVFASDGSEFTAAQAQWMQAQLALVAKACVNGDAADAARRLAEVQQLLSEHRRAFS